MGRAIRRLVLVSDAPHFGGAERYLVAMARAAKRRGMEASIWWLPIAGGREDVFDRTEAAGVEIARTPAADRRSVFGLARAFGRIRRAYRPEGLVINGSGRPGYWLLAALARAARVPCVWVHQMVDGRDHRRLPARRLGGRIEGLQLWRVPQTLRHGLAAAAATSVVVLNGEDGERIVRWQRVPRDKIHVVPHGVDLERFRFDEVSRERLRREWRVTDETGPIVGTAGRAVPGKGIEWLIEAVARLRRRGTCCRLVIAGEGPYRAVGEQLAERLGVADLVRWVGFIEDMVSFYSALDVFALCSATESFGLALAEAMACERVVIGTPTAGAGRQIEHGRTGRQLRSFDPDELADGLAGLFAESERFAEMGRRARASVEQRFSIELTLERTLRALGSRRRSGGREVKWGMDVCCEAGAAEARR